MDIHEITDWFIPADALADAVVYPGPREVPQALQPALRRLLELAMLRSQTHSDYAIDLDGVRYRGHRQLTVGGECHVLRRISDTLPRIEKLGMPADVVRAVCHPSFGNSGGLVLVSGATGHGKSTSCAAIIMERVKRHGAFCLTVEDPPEFPMHGNHPAADGRMGKVMQVPADGRSFPNDLRDALRCYPANQAGTMLLVGEIRDASTASLVLSAAVNGHLVFATLHAGELVATLERVLALARGEMGSEEASTLLGHSLRAVLHQQIVGGRLQMTHLFSSGPASGVCATIKRAVSR
jgi:Tfp pilus assembly pilus retraction ATPase PilT